MNLVLVYYYLYMFSFLHFWNKKYSGKWQLYSNMIQFSVIYTQYSIIQYSAIYYVHNLFQYCYDTFTSPLISIVTNTREYVLAIQLSMDWGLHFSLVSPR